jgi:hypothetical protein
VLAPLAPFREAATGRFAADAGLRPGLGIAVVRLAEGAAAVDRRAAERGVVERRPYSRSGTIALSSFLSAFCFVFFPTPVPRTIAVLLCVRPRAIDHASTRALPVAEAVHASGQRARFR